MSMLSAQCDELRIMANISELPDGVRLALRQAADTIWELRCKLNDEQDENTRLRSCLTDAAENARLIMGENAKLRELVEDMLDCIEIRAAWHRPPTEGMCEEFAKRASELGVVE